MKLYDVIYLGLAYNEKCAVQSAFLLQALGHSPVSKESQHHHPNVREAALNVSMSVLFQHWNHNSYTMKKG